MDGLRARIRTIGGEGSSWRTLASVALALLAACGVALEHGFGHRILPDWAVASIQLGMSWLALVAGGDVRWGRLSRDRWRHRVGTLGEMLIVAGVLGEIAGAAFGGETVAMVVFVTLVCRANGRLARTMRNPSLLFPASFIVLIAACTALLKLPASTPGDQPISWTDSAFTITSAVCVTGLSVRDTASGFTPFGQLVVLGSIQLGGLGVMIFGSTLALLFGARLSLRENMTLSMALSEYPVHRISRFVWFIVLTTFGLEALGAGVMYLTWPAELAATTGERVWQSVFHSVSAFCNAGFDITGDSMIPMRGGLAPFVGVLPMIVLGGLGFVVLEDVFQMGISRLRRGQRPHRLTTHTKLVLATTLGLLVFGAIGIVVAQLRVPGTGAGQRVLDGLFMSTTARTAGFTSVPMDDLTTGARFVLMTLMAIGGSPGSTAGGIKTTVFAVLLLAVVSTVRGREEVEVFGRALPDAIVKKAATVAFGVVTLIALTTLVLDMTERQTFESLFFESISAATTTGLSLGVTSHLTGAGRWVLIGTMFLGRVGPLAVLASLLVGGAGRGAYRFPRDTVSLG